MKKEHWIELILLGVCMYTSVTQPFSVQINLISLFKKGLVKLINENMWGRNWVVKFCSWFAIPPVGSYFIFNFLTIEYNYNMIIMKNKGWELIPLCKFCNFWSWHEKETTKRTNIRFRASGIGLDNNQL